ncbi:MAG: hypothetical protein GIW96_01955 [Candidatus Eremiobacteraeota bacterium]|nr:hypothetical protein [Candidatus Eremiobacteraeota bacterium]
MSQKHVPKRKGGIPLDELLSAAGDDDRLNDLRARYRGSSFRRRLRGVSMDEQTTALQLVDALRSAGCHVLHEDSASGGSRSRPALGRALEVLVADDTLMV